MPQRFEKKLSVDVTKANFEVAIERRSTRIPFKTPWVPGRKGEEVTRTQSSCAPSQPGSDRKVSSRRRWARRRGLRARARVSAAVRRLGCRSDGPRPLPSAGQTAKAPASPMDAAQERLQALSHTQQALMDKIKALDELDQAGGEPLSCALSPCPHAEGQHARPAHAPQRVRPPPSQIMVSSESRK